MEWSHNHVSMSGYLNGKLIEETISNGPAYYRPAYLAPNRWAHELRKPVSERRSGPSYFICFKLAGPAVVRIKLPSWVSVRVMFS